MGESEETSGRTSQDSPPEDFVSDLLTYSYRERRPGLGEMRHGTEGWQALETSFVASLAT